MQLFSIDSIPARSASYCLLRERYVERQKLHSPVACSFALFSTITIFSRRRVNEELGHILI